MNSENSGSESLKYQFDVEGMTCAACVSNVETAIQKVQGVQTVSVNLATESATVTASRPIELNQLSNTISKLGYVLQAKGSASLLQKQQKRVTTWKNLLLLQSIFGIPLLLYAMAEMFLGFHFGSKTLSIFIQFTLATILVISGSGYYRRGFRHLLMRVPNMDSLVALGTGAAYVYSLISSVNLLWGLGISDFNVLYYEAAGTILLFITFGKWLEATARGKTTEALSGLIEELPNEAEVLRDDKWVLLPLDEVGVDDKVRVQPHSKIPVDGLIVEGSTSVDESAISGESIPVDKHVGSYVVAASMNLQSPFEMHAKKIGRDSLFGQVVTLVENAQSKKPEIQKRVDRIASIFVPVVLSLALLSSLIWLLAGFPLTFALNVLISVLIIACPCALGLATPTALVVGSGIAAKEGILFKTPDAFQKLAEMDHIIFDKTGTLTEGKARVVEVFPESKTEISEYAIGMSQKSRHPLAMAITQFGLENDIQATQFDTISEVAGSGMEATQGKDKFSLHRIEDDEALPSGFSAKLDAFLDQGYTVSAISKNDTVLALIAFADEVKPEGPQMVDYFTTLGIQSTLLTGDRKRVAENIAAQLGIDRVLAEVLPTDKHEEIVSIQEQGKVTGMVGDGINDAPALVAADIGISFSSGTDIATNAADLIFLNTSLHNLIFAHRIARSTFSKINQNLFWAFIYNSVGIPVAMGVLYPFTGTLLNPMVAGLAMALSSVSVVANTLLLRTGKYFSLK
ncbi:MAG: heavy metal translocating P-type ATPase [Candidatus Marinimicrobia bacterium]|nr:heavy metal translocating P-type ATPase [Candidatus Neomarinimicrobiota bacterium]MCF7851069.1 heavy metal translocating P-type ATPase [Candidatus Neomarinimicrobiota bacterium]MCF7904039.1 heavy metal translocating P-type ATPase [Candidatus Neomarinimicrobiota bacterium]